MELDTYKVFDTWQYRLRKSTDVVTCLELTRIECVAASLYSNLFKIQSAYKLSEDFAKPYFRKY